MLARPDLLKIFELIVKKKNILETLANWGWSILSGLTELLMSSDLAKNTGALRPFKLTEATIGVRPLKCWNFGWDHPVFFCINKW